LTCCAPLPFNDRFVDWILGIRERIKFDAESIEASVRESITEGVRQCLKFGVTTVGDISQQMHLTRQLLKNGPIRVVSFGEVLGLAGRRPRFVELFAEAIDESSASEFLRVGISPHAPYTVDLDGYIQVLNYAQRRNMPLATHLSETPDEHSFLRDLSGAFQEMWDRLGHWHDDVPTHKDSPIKFARAIGLLDAPNALLAHVNYCDDDELELLARGKASVVFCPRTHAYFNHPPHRWRQMLTQGVNVAVGTDSCASSPDLNVVDDLRLLRKAAPEIPAHTLWEMVTTRAAKALGMNDAVGSLMRGKQADLIAFEVENNPLEELLENSGRPTVAWVAGTPVAR
jgi:cytosine/adenosine deaminase-related metal-dependent hydrolase